VIRILAVAFFLALVGVTYQSVGFMAMERELGMSQLMEAMMPNKRRWEPQVARLLSYHIAFDMIYLPGWIICGAIVSGLVFPDTSVRAPTYLNIATYSDIHSTR
jgi:ATP-binding cassette subfamily A (ABC1) protein 3